MTKLHKKSLSKLSEKVLTSLGWIANIVAGLVGSSIGEAILGSWGPQLAGMAIIPSIIGAVIVVAVVSFFVGKSKN
jgi:uncharacterized membrane protein YeaQ/YmgE (transglycosylase-associated protein family)